MGIGLSASGVNLNRLPGEMCGGRGGGRGSKHDDTCMCVYYGPLIMSTRCVGTCTCMTSCFHVF